MPASAGGATTVGADRVSGSEVHPVRSPDGEQPGVARSGLNIDDGDDRFDPSTPVAAGADSPADAVGSPQQRFGVAAPVVVDQVAGVEALQGVTDGVAASSSFQSIANTERTRRPKRWSGRFIRRHNLGHLAG